VAIGLSAPLFAVAPRNDPSRLFLNAPLHPSFSALRSPCMPPSGSVRFSFTPGSSPFVNSTPASQRVLGHLHAGVLHRLGARDRDLEDRPVRLALEAHSGVDGGGVEAERARRRCGRWRTHRRLALIMASTAVRLATRILLLLRARFDLHRCISPDARITL